MWRPGRGSVDWNANKEATVQGLVFARSTNTCSAWTMWFLQGAPLHRPAEFLWFEANEPYAAFIKLKRGNVLCAHSSSSGGSRTLDTRRLACWSARGGSQKQGGAGKVCLFSDSLSASKVCGETTSAGLDKFRWRFFFFLLHFFFNGDAEPPFEDWLTFGGYQLPPAGQNSRPRRKVFHIKWRRL